MRATHKRSIFLAIPIVGLLVWFSVLRVERLILRWRYYLSSGHPTAVQLKAAQALAVGRRIPRTPLSQLKPVNSGVGVVVAEPVSAADGNLAAFGAGCSRWLELEVGGQPQFGKTPSWRRVDAARREIGWRNLRLKPLEAGRLAKVLSITHVALSHLEGTPAHCSLSYQWFVVGPAPGARPLAVPVITSGSSAQVATQLPFMARQLCAQLGVAAPRLAPVAGVAAPGLQLLGRVPWDTRLPIPQATARQLETLAQRSPLAGVLFFHSATLLDNDYSREYVRQLMTQAPGNTLALDTVAAFAPEELKGYPAQLTALSQRFARNYLVAASVGQWCAACGDQRGAHFMAEQAVRCAPRSSQAWLVLAHQLFAETAVVRHGRIMRYLTAPERQYLTTLYQQWGQTAETAAALDPHDSDAWFEVSRAAAFNGNHKIAANAFWKALKLNRDATATYSWGLQLYGSHWLGDPAQLLKVAKLAADGPRFGVLYTDIYSALQDSGLKTQAAQYRAAAEAYFQSRLRQHPQDVAAYIALGYMDDYAGRYQPALQMFQTALKLKPCTPLQYARACYKVGEILHYSAGNTHDAAGFYRQAVALDPEYADPINGLAQIEQFAQGNYPTAEQYYRQAIALRPTDGFFHANLGLLLLHEGRTNEAITEAHLAAALGTTDHDLFRELNV